MGTKYLIDTNAVIEFLGGSLPTQGSHFLQEIIDQNRHHLSVVNQIELLGFDGPPDEMQIIQDFIDITNVMPLSASVIQKTIELRKSHKIKLPDAIISATALTNNLTLITRNDRDFQKVTRLQCLDLHQKE